jgi:hypothetical protein
MEVPWVDSPLGARGERGIVLCNVSLSIAHPFIPEGISRTTIGLRVGSPSGIKGVNAAVVPIQLLSLLKMYLNFPSHCLS